MNRSQTPRLRSLTESCTTCTLEFEGRRPAKLHPSLRGASSLGQAELNLPQLSPQIHARRNSGVRFKLLVGVCAAAIASALSLSSVALPRAQAQQQSPPPPRTPARPGAPPPRAMRPVTPQVTIESSQQLFATMCALWAAGYYTGSGPEDLPTAWRAVADEMLRHQGPATDEIHQYLDQHKTSDRAATLSRFISFALVVGPPPDFVYTFRHEDLPPDVLAIEDFNGLLAKFYKEAQVDAAWQRVKPSYQNGVAQLQGPLTLIVQRTMAYLREVLKSESPRTFTVYIEPLAGVSTNFRAYRDAYSVVLSGDNVSLTQLRYAFLHFLLDQLPLRYPAALLAARPVLLSAARAPRLPQEYRDDLSGLYAECLVKAVEIQLDRLTPPQRAQALDAADADGYVLVRPLVARLEKFQQEDPAMSYYFPDLAKGIDVAAELKRVQSLQFAPAQEPPPVTGEAAEAAEREGMLEQGERLLNAQDGAGAQAVFEKVLQRWPGTQRATYGLAIAAVYQLHMDRAKELFTSLTQSPATAAVTDPVILAWSHIYLGRISDREGNREKAIAEYRAALSVQGAPERARKAAQSGIEKPYVPVQAGDHPGGPGNP